MIILCNGMIRSGSTFQYNIIRDLLIKNKLNYKSLGFLNKEAIENDFNTFKKNAEEPNMFYLIKTHNYTGLNSLDNVFVIYSFRNLLDVAASIKRKFGKDKKDLFLALENIMNDYYGIITSKRILTQAYSNLLDSPNACVKEIVNFLNFNTTDKIVNEIVEANKVENIAIRQNKNQFLKRLKELLLNTFVSLKGIKTILIFLFGRKIVNKIKFFLLPHDKESLLHLNHVSKNLGKNGLWIEILEEQEINEIKKRFNDWMIKNNYL